MHETRRDDPSTTHLQPMKTALSPVGADRHAFEFDRTLGGKGIDHAGQRAGCTSTCVACALAGR
ncbi:MAG: hypothetical protein AAGO57_04785 [Pseudomonadota bacterium]